MKSKEQKRIEAEVRQEEYAALSHSERLRRVHASPGESRREKPRVLAAFVANEVANGSPLQAWEIELLNA